MFDTIDVDQIQRRLDDLWEIGKTSQGGVTRLAYSKQENEAFEYLLGELSDEYTVEIDSTGNAFATREPDAACSVYTGSHLDTVFNGGRLDGALGVVASLEAIEAVYRADIEPTCPPTLAIFRGEESARFGHHTVGSRAALGLLEVETFSSTDQNGVPLWQAMQKAELQPYNLSRPSIDLDRVAGFLEIHIEQGRVLEEEARDVGVVSSIRAPSRYRVTVLGDDDHSGATPMGMRRDAVAAASEMIHTIESIAESASTEGDIVATVGDVTTVNGAINKVCGEVEFTLDIRSADGEFKRDIEEEIVDELERIAKRRDVAVEPGFLERSSPARLDEGMIELLERGAEATGASYLTLPSGGGHDAMNFQEVGIPTGMLFVSSIDGISHSPKEETPAEAIEHATRTLAYALAEYEDEE